MTKTSVASVQSGPKLYIHQLTTTD